MTKITKNLIKSAFLIIVVATCLLPYNSNAENGFICFHDQNERWCYTIIDYLAASSYNAAPGVEASIVSYGEAICINGITVRIVEALFDVYSGITNVEFSSQTYIFRPLECLNPSSPWYDTTSDSEWSVCYVDYSLVIDGVDVLFDTDAYGLAADQHSLNHIKVDLPSFTTAYKPFENNATISISLLFFDDHGNIQQSFESIQFELTILNCIDHALVSKSIGFRGFTLPQIGIYLTPIWYMIDHKGITQGNAVRYSDSIYDWRILDMQGFEMADSFNGGYYRETIPETIILQIAEYERNTGRFIRICEQWTLVRSEFNYAVMSQ